MVFQQPSRGENTILEIIQQEEPVRERHARTHAHAHNRLIGRDSVDRVK